MNIKHLISVLNTARCCERNILCWVREGAPGEGCCLGGLWVGLHGIAWLALCHQSRANEVIKPRE